LTAATNQKCESLSAVRGNYYENYETDTRQRVFGYASLDYKVTNWLSLLGRASVDNYTELQEEGKILL
jgi:hypothetical protein